MVTPFFGLHTIHVLRIERKVVSTVLQSEATTFPGSVNCHERKNITLRNYSGSKTHVVGVDEATRVAFSIDYTEIDGS